MIFTCLAVRRPKHNRLSPAFEQKNTQSILQWKFTSSTWHTRSGRQCRQARTLVSVTHRSVGAIITHIKCESEMKTKTIYANTHTRFPKWKTDDDGTFAFEFHLSARMWHEICLRPYYLLHSAKWCCWWLCVRMNVKKITTCPHESYERIFEPKTDPLRHSPIAKASRNWNRQFITRTRRMRALFEIA